MQRIGARYVHPDMIPGSLRVKSLPAISREPGHQLVEVVGGDDLIGLHLAVGLVLAYHLAEVIKQLQCICQQHTIGRYSPVMKDILAKRCLSGIIPIEFYIQNLYIIAFCSHDAKLIIIAITNNDG